MRIIQCRYFDGKYSKAHPVNAILNTSSINILSIEPDKFHSVHQVWSIDKLEDIDFTSSETVHLKYGNFPYQSLIIENVDDVQYFRNIYPQLHKKNIYRNVLSGNINKILAFSVSALLLVVGFYMLVVAPFISAQVVKFVPISAEVTLGNKMTEHLFTAMDVDPDKSEILQDFFEELGYKTNYPIELNVETSSTVNAFAVPGGKIVVYQGIIDKMKSWHELAGLLGHELAHVEQQHSLKAMSRSLSTYLIFSIITSDISGISTVLLDNCMMLQDLSNSRTAEQEADEYGIQYMLEQNIDPTGMVDLFKVLQAEEQLLKTEEGATKKILKMMSTHPLTEDRIVYLKEATAKYADTVFPKNDKAKLLFEKLKGETELEEYPQILIDLDSQIDFDK